MHSIFRVQSFFLYLIINPEQTLCGVRTQKQAMEVGSALQLLITHYAAMSKENKALTLAYNCVCSLGWNHSRISKEYHIPLPTLRRIRKGEKGKTATDEYCLKVFILIINKEFRYDLENKCSNNSAFFNTAFREILFSLIRIDEVK